MINTTNEIPCLVCHGPLSLRLARGRKSGKPSIMLICPSDGRHFRGFISDRSYADAEGCTGGQGIGFGSPSFCLPGSPESGKPRWRGGRGLTSGEIDIYRSIIFPDQLATDKIVDLQQPGNKNGPFS